MMMIDRYTFRVVFALLIILAVLMVWKTLHRMTAQPLSENTYDAQDLLMENGRASRAAHLMWGSYAAMTWYFIYAALTDKMSDVLFGTYGTLCLAPTIARLIWNPSMSPPTQAQTTTTTTTETK